MTPPTQEEELFKEAAWKEFPGLMTVFIKNDESRKLRIFNLKEEPISVYDNSDPAEKQQVDNRVLHEAFLRGAMYAHNLAQQEIERVKRGMFEIGLSIGSRNPGIHETEGVYDKLIGKQSKQAEGVK